MVEYSICWEPKKPEFSYTIKDCTLKRAGEDYWNHYKKRFSIFSQKYDSQELLKLNNIYESLARTSIGDYLKGINNAMKKDTTLTDIIEENPCAYLLYDSLEFTSIPNCTSISIIKNDEAVFARTMDTSHYYLNFINSIKYENIKELKNDFLINGFDFLIGGPTGINNKGIGICANTLLGVKNKLIKEGEYYTPCTLIMKTLSQSQTLEHALSLIKKAKVPNYVSFLIFSPENSYKIYSMGEEKKVEKSNYEYCVLTNHHPKYETSMMRHSKERLLRAEQLIKEKIGSEELYKLSRRIITDHDGRKINHEKEHLSNNNICNNNTISGTIIRIKNNKIIVETRKDFPCLKFKKSFVQ